MDVEVTVKKLRKPAIVYIFRIAVCSSLIVDVASVGPQLYLTGAVLSYIAPLKHLTSITVVHLKTPLICTRDVHGNGNPMGMGQEFNKQWEWESIRCTPCFRKKHPLILLAIS